MPDSYINPARTGYVNVTGIDLPSTVNEKNRWRVRSDKDRIKLFETLWDLYSGNHYQGQGGPFKHPLGIRGIKEGILYQQINLLGKCTNVFADMITGAVSEGSLTVNSEDETIQNILDEIKYETLIWEALVRASVGGYLGFQPVQKKRYNRTAGEDEYYWTFRLVNPANLFLEFSPTDDELISIRKCVIFNNIEVRKDRKIDVLYEELHIPGVVETHLYHVQGDYRVSELPLNFYNRYIDKNQELVEIWETGLSDFLITILYNNIINNQVLSDYTTTAIGQQESLNDVLTSTRRVIKVHANPKLMAPNNAARKDEHTGEWRWIHENSEVLFYPQGESQPYSYLTWDGNIDQAVKERDTIILSLLTEIGVAPEFLSYTNLVTSTSAETASKLKRLTNSTLKVASRKVEFLDQALTQVTKNILILSEIENYEDFSIYYPEFIPQDREEIMAEVMNRKQNGLITTVDSLIRLDNLSEEDAIKKANEIFNEQNKTNASSLDSFYNVDSQKDELSQLPEDGTTGIADKVSDIDKITEEDKQ